MDRCAWTKVLGRYLKQTVVLFVFNLFIPLLCQESKEIIVKSFSSLSCYVLMFSQDNRQTKCWFT